MAASLQAMREQARMMRYGFIAMAVISVAIIVGGVVMHSITLDRILNADIETERAMTTTSEITNDDGSTMSGNNINIGRVK